VCGEQRAITTSTRTSSGSSPRVRGTDPPLCCPYARLRFIPACAGNSRCPEHLTLDETVHPRVCGEQNLLLVRPIPIHGSSPRVRGTDLNRLAPRSWWRFIPACAGNSDDHWLHSPPTPVHPRVCGEQIKSSGTTNCHCGSSPRVRGTVTLPLHRVQIVRFIPACAGNR